MQQLDFAIIDAHIHQWDASHMPYSAALAVKLLAKHPYLLDKLVRLVKSDELIETLGLTNHLTAPYLPENYMQDIGHYLVEQVVHVEA
ncbi:MAG: amidohydrolase, partial [Acinetobacter bohemicus]